MLGAVTGPLHVHLLSTHSCEAYTDVCAPDLIAIEELFEGWQLPVGQLS